MPTANDRLADLGIRNQVNVLRYTKGQLNNIRKLLRESEIDLTRQLFAAGTEFKRSRLSDMLAAVRSYSQEVESQMFGYAQQSLGKLGQQQAGVAFTDLQAAIDRSLPKGTAISLTTPDFGVIAKAAISKPMHGKLLKEWWREWGTGVRAAVSQQVRLGLVENEGIDVIVRRIIGTKARNFKDGILAVKRRHAEALVRTSVNAVATQAKNDVYEANSDVVDSVQWNSTLDGKTTPICQARDGKRAATGGRDQSSIPASQRLKPPSARPPAHIGCRSTIVPVITDWESLGLENPPPSTRASMNGQVPDSLDYESWLRKQATQPGGRAFVNSVLGKTKAELFLKGKLSLTKFVDGAGNALSLTDLKRLNPKAWKVAFAGKGGLRKKISKPKPKPKPKPKAAPKPPAKPGSTKAKLVEGTQEVLDTGNSGVTQSQLLGLLDDMPGAGAQVKQFKQYLAKFQTGSIFATAEQINATSVSGFSGWLKGLGKAVSHASKKTAWPRHKGSRFNGYTWHHWNYVVVKSTLRKKSGPQRGKPYNLSGGFTDDARPNNLPFEVESLIKNRGTKTKKQLWWSMSGRAYSLGTTEQTRMFVTWLHEMGHQVHFRAGFPGMPKFMTRKRLTEYSYTDAYEFHAEHFVAWLVNRKAVYEWQPKLALYFDELMEKAMASGPGG